MLSIVQIQELTKVGIWDGVAIETVSWTKACFCWVDSVTVWMIEDEEEKTGLRWWKVE